MCFIEVIYFHLTFIKYLLYTEQCSGLWAHQVIKIRLVDFTTLGCNCDKCNEVELHSSQLMDSEGLLAEGDIGEFP